jgi:hypothetical protein
MNPKEFIQLKLPAVTLPMVSDWFDGKNIEQYNYLFPDLLKIKDDLNKEKHKMDKYYSTNTTAKNFIRVTNRFYYYVDLKSGNLEDVYNAQFVTKAWLKIYELFYVFGRDQLEELNKKKSNYKYYSFHIAEAPGAFLPSINHLIKTNYNKIEWFWFAESFRLIYDKKMKNMGDTHYLGDTYGIINKYKDNWIFGADGDGDITSSANLRWFKHKIYSEFDRFVDFYTSDVKFIPTENFSYDDEEIYNIPVHVGHTIGAIVTLKKNGLAILKTFTFMESASVCLLYLLSGIFDNVYVTKPLASTPSNSETYIVCDGYKKNLSKIQIEKLFEYLDCLVYEDKKNLCLFKKEDISRGFLDEIKKINSFFYNRQKYFINRNIELYEQYKNKDNQTILKDSSKMRQEYASYWIKRYSLKKIDSSDLL